MRKYNVFTKVFNPCRGEVEILLCSVYAADMADAMFQARQQATPDETVVVRRAN